MPAFARGRGRPADDAHRSRLLAEGIKTATGGRQRADGGAHRPTSRPTATTGEPRSAGAGVFARACAGCHGDQGQGGERRRQAGAINDPAFLALISDQALRRIVITGRPDLGMPDLRRHGRPAAPISSR